LDFWDNLGKLLLDMTKLTFASFILGGILKGELPQNVLIAAGSIVFLIHSKDEVGDLALYFNETLEKIKNLNSTTMLKIKALMSRKPRPPLSR
jgi:methyl-accepting chemotaxis protein